MVWRRSCLAVSTPWVMGAGLDMAMEEVIEEGVAEDVILANNREFFCILANNREFFP